MIWILYYLAGVFSYTITGVYAARNKTYPSLFRLGSISPFGDMVVFVVLWPLALPISYIEIRQNIKTSDPCPNPRDRISGLPTEHEKK